VPGWLRTSLVIAAIVAGAALLWFGLVLLVAALVIVALPFWLWSLFAPRRRPAGPVTYEGAATRVDESITPLPVDEKSRQPDPPREPGKG
jgi:hypothetical protein